jgi:sec-independent protein translocase protein TatC
MAAQVAPPDEFKMSLAEHLGELRKRMLRITISVLILGAVSMVFAKEIYGFLMQPVLRALPPEAAALVYTSAIEEINVYMKVGLYAGVFLTTPVILWQIWGFVSPGLYSDERKLAGPFIIFGTLAFLAGAAFCYFGLLPQMFTYLLREESSVALEARLNTGRLRGEDAFRFLRLGDLERAGQLARETNVELEAAGDGQAKATKGFMGMGVTLNPKRSVEALARIEGLGKLIDVTRDGLGDSAKPALAMVMEKRQSAVEAYAKADWNGVNVACDEAAEFLKQARIERADDFSALWQVTRNLSAGRAAYEAANWTRPMLSMTEQLTLVLVLELAFGVIFELPLVMAVLGMVGLVKSSFLFKYQRHAFVVCLIAAAVITPTGDAVNLALMAGPMLACYELGVVLVWIIEKRRARQAPPPEATS